MSRGNVSPWGRCCSLCSWRGPTSRLTGWKTKHEKNLDSPAHNKAHATLGV